MKVDEAELAQGGNAVGGGTADLDNSELEMARVKADVLFTDEDLDVIFNGGNEIAQVDVAGSAHVDISFTGENEVGEVHAFGSSDVTINADGHNDFEEIEAYEESNVTILVTGENEFEEISGRDDADITVRGTDCPQNDIVVLGEDEYDTEISTERGTLEIDHATVELEGADAQIGSTDGNVVIDTSKIAEGDDNEYAYVFAGGTMEVSESVVDITGMVYSVGEMTIEHSDVTVEEPDPEFDDKSPYRVYSETGIELIDEENGTVRTGETIDGEVFYVDTDENDGKKVDLEAEGDPAYYSCPGEPVPQMKAMPATHDATNPLMPMATAIASAATAVFAARRRDDFD